MDVTLAYGTEGLTVTVPDDATVVTPTDLPALDDEQASVRDAVRDRVRGLVRPGRRIAVVIPDITRPMPSRTVLPPLLDEVGSAGATPDDVVLLVATGTHRPATDDEIVELVGEEIAARYEIKNHVATDDAAHVEVGTVDGVPILLDRDYVHAAVRILTGFVEPHFFAGFSGGPKGACPGLAALSTILEAHSPARIASPDATWLRIDGNPVHDFVRSAHRLCPGDLSVDVAINRRRQVTAVFTDHRQACAFVERTAVQRVPSRFDVVVTTNSGYPLDRNLYQAVKGMAAAERVVRDGGRIVAAAECRDGVPAEGRFGELLAAAATPDDLVDATAPLELDRWEAQVLGRVRQRASVSLYAAGLSPDEIRRCHLEPVDDLRWLADVDGSVCVLPEGPQTVVSAG